MVAIAPHMAKYGAMKDAIAFTNCPKVSVEARFPPRMTEETRGFSDVCINAFPIPKSEKEMSMR